METSANTPSRPASASEDIVISGTDFIIFNFSAYTDLILVENEKYYLNF